MPQTPSISVLLPVHNAAATLEACLASLERQSRTDWECVVVDDGSTDGTAALLERFARRDRRFRISGGPHRGLVAALNIGLARCRGELVARMDADDLMHRARLAVQAQTLRSHPEWAAVGSHVRIFPRSALGPGYREYERWINSMESPDEVRRESWIECPVAHPSLMIRRATLTGSGYRDLGWPEDYDLVLRLLTRGERIGVVPRRLLGWRHTVNRLSRTQPSYRPECFTACKAHFLSTTFLADHPRYVLWGYGGTGRALRRALEPLGKTPSFIVELHPRRLGNTIHGARVIPRTDLAQLPRQPLLISVAGAGPRGEIRSYLNSIGFAETTDYICTA